MDDLSDLLQIRSATISAIDSSYYSRKQLTRWRNADAFSRYRQLIEVNSLWVIGKPGKPIASSGIHLPSQQLIAIFTSLKHTGRGLATKLINHAEQQASRFGIRELNCEASLNAISLYEQLGYKGLQNSPTCDSLNLPCLIMTKSLYRRQTRYQKQILNNLPRLGIDQDYGIKHALPIQKTPKRLINADLDCYKRQLQLTPKTASAWCKLRRAAATAGINLQAVSGYRNVDYQTTIIERKLAQKQKIDDILRVSAAPGFSEHHTGRAIDLITSDSPPLEQQFAGTNAYRWLQHHAQRFGFIESYPKGNPHHILWEPWHWCYRS